MTSVASEVKFTIALVIIVFVCLSFGIYHDSVNKFHVNKYFLRCSYSDVVRVMNDFSFECKEFDAIYVGRKEISKSDKQLLEKVNAHCISYNEKNNCKTMITNYTANEVKEIYTRKKVINSDALGYLD